MAPSSSRDLKSVAQQTTAAWDKAFALAPALQWTGEAPSIGLLDLVSHPFRGINAPPEFIRVLSFLFADTLQRSAHFGSCRIVDNLDGVALIRNDGEEQFRIDIEQLVREGLESRSKTLSLHDGKGRKFRSPMGELSAIFKACMTGSLRSLDPAFHVLDGAGEKELALSFGRYFERIAPEFPLAAVAEFYLDGVLFPPIGVDEPFPGLRAVREVLEKGKEYGLRPEMTERLAELFLLTPDEQLASIGAILIGIFQPPTLREPIRARCERFGRFFGMLRQTITFLRREILQERDWLLKDKLEQSDLERIHFEQELGMLPWLFLTPEEIAKRWGEMRFRKLAEALIFFDYDFAIGQLETLIAEDPKQFALRKQQIYLFLLGKKFTEALRLIQQLYSEPGCEVDAELLWLWSTHALSTGDIEGAKRHGREAIGALQEGNTFAGKLFNDYGWILFQNQEYQAALAAFDESIRFGGSHLTALLNKGSTFARLGWSENLLPLKQQVAQLAPSDPRSVMLFLS